MKVVKLENFQEFESWIEALKERQQQDSSGRHYSNLLFRGHADETWKLQTTLERYAGEIKSLDEYLHKANRIKLQVELHTGKKWDPILKDGFVIKFDEHEYRASLPSIEYLVYLRHHGFPSPLLDWTRSPYIAALFAYSECENHAEGNIAIFVYQEYAGAAKAGYLGAPTIQTIGQFIDTHKRHSIQQAEYTLCHTQKEQEWGESEYLIHPHEEYQNSGNHDLLYKFILPKSEKLKMLFKFNQFNLNLYSIYGSEESLMKTLALQEFDLRWYN